MHPDSLSLTPKVEWSRREFVTTVLASGFALAVQPASAQTITTDSVGLTAGEVKITVRDGSIPAYRAMPATGKDFPVVLVVQEIFGVHEYLKDVCRRFGKLGYLAIAPELYARQGDVSKLSGADEILRRVVSQVPDAQVMADLDAAAAWTAKTGKADAARLGITGFCWGGRIVWLYAAHNPHLKAGVAWYGRLAGDRSELQPRYPIGIAGSLKAPVLGLYGGRDQGIPQESIERMRAALKAADSRSEIVVYPDASHGFHADYRPSYAKDAAQDGFRRLQAWFKRFGVA